MPSHYATFSDEAPSPRLGGGGGCYPFLRSASRRGYRRLASDGAVRVEVGTRERSVFHVDPEVLDSELVRRLLAAAGRRLAGGALAVGVDAILFEHLLWLAGNEGLDDSAVDLGEIVEFYSQDDDDGGNDSF